MLDFRLAGLTLYYSATRTMRAFFARRWRVRSSVPMTVLMYHHVGVSCPLPWTTSLPAFRRHVDWLSKHTEVVSLHEIRRRLAVGNCALRPCVAITFDDGYAANLDEALPLLLNAAMPVTFFVTVSNVLNGQPFAHDMEWGQAFSPVSPRELRDLADSGVEIGSHGLTHADFSQLPEVDLIREITESKAILEDLIGQPVRSLAVPFGQPRQMTHLVFRIAREAGYDCLCSAYGGYNVPGRHLYHIRRFHGDDSLIQLINRATLDPRLVWKTLFQDPISPEQEKESYPSKPIRGNDASPLGSLAPRHDQPGSTDNATIASSTAVVDPVPEDTTFCPPDGLALGGKP